MDFERVLSQTLAVREQGESVFGPLETKVLDVLWGNGRAVTVRHVLAAFPELADSRVPLPAAGSVLREQG